MFFIIPGRIVSLITFPGVILHEISHRFFCDITNVPVYDIQYFSLQNEKAGYVIHEKTCSQTKAFLISFGPLMINIIVFAVLTIPFGTRMLFGTHYLQTTQSYNIFYEIVMTWIGWSCGLHAFPSETDMETFSETKKSLLVALLNFCLGIFNIESIGFIFRAFLLYQISKIIPYIIFS